MEIKHNSLHTKKSKLKDLCPICDKNLYLDSNYTQRIGLIDKDREVTGWICPECDSEFDLNDNIVYIYGENYEQGEA